MAISKLILNGEVQMDVTSNTNTAANMLSGVVGTKNDGTSVTGNIATKTSSDLTASGATVTAPAGYYANAASKTVSTTTHPNPSASIASSTGVVTASHTQTAGYVTAGTTTGTLNLTTQAGKTVTPTESAQTAVASYRWTTGTVSVAAISSTYVGTGVAKKSSADLTANGSTVTAPAGYYSTTATKSISTGSAFPPAVTITKAPTIGVNTSGVVTASYNGSSSITPTVTSGYISQGTAGTISTTGTSTYQLTSQAAATYYPSTTDQTIASQRWLVGNQTIKSVTTSNLTAANIADGVTVQVGDSSDASRITQVTGTHKGEQLYPRKYIAHYVEVEGSSTYVNTLRITNNTSGKVETFSGTTSTINLGALIDYDEGDSLTLYVTGRLGAKLYINDTKVGDSGQDTTLSYSWTAPATNTSIKIVPTSSSCSVYIYTDDSAAEGGYTVDQIAMRTISGDISGNTTSIYSCAFHGCAGLTTASFPLCTSIGSSAFYYCSRLTTISFPSVTTIGSNAFYYCYNLTTASFSLCTSIGSSAFYFCSKLTTASFPSVTTIGNSAFNSCYSLTTASFPNVTTIGSYAFNGCSKLTAASFLNATSIGNYAFRSCYSLTTISFPNVTTIGASAFSNCYNLVSAIFLASSVIFLGTNAFGGTPIGDYTTSTGGVYGSIYVPASLVDSYKTATNWSVYSERITSYIE